MADMSAVNDQVRRQRIRRTVALLAVLVLVVYVGFYVLMARV